MTDLQVFSFQGQPIRTVVDDAGEPWWVATDVCKALEIVNTTNALRPLPDHWKGLQRVKTPGGTQELAVVSESGLYKIIMRSDKPRAQPFQDWVCSEVIPSIRKTGRYEMPAAPPKDPILATLESIAEVRRQQIEHEARLTAVEAKATAALAGVQSDTRFVTLQGYCSLHGIRLPKADLAQIGMRLRKQCLAAGLPFRKIPNEAHGEVNVWPVEVLDAWAASRLAAAS